MSFGLGRVPFLHRMKQKCNDLQFFCKSGTMDPGTGISAAVLEELIQSCENPKKPWINEM